MWSNEILIDNILEFQVIWGSLELTLLKTPTIGGKCCCCWDLKAKHGQTCNILQFEGFQLFILLVFSVIGKLVVNYDHFKIIWYVARSPHTRILALHDGYVDKCNTGS